MNSSKMLGPKEVVDIKEADQKTGNNIATGEQHGNIQAKKVISPPTSPRLSVAADINTNLPSPQRS